MLLIGQYFLKMVVPFQKVVFVPNFQGGDFDSFIAPVS